SPNDFRAYKWRPAAVSLPDNLVPLVHADNAGLDFIFIVIPGDSSVICHLAATTRVKYGSVKCYFIAFDGDNSGGAFIGKAIFVIEQFCLHCYAAPVNLL